MSHDPDNIHLPEMPLPPEPPPEDDFPCCSQWLTAAEVKVLTEAALRQGRKEAGEEIAAEFEYLGVILGSYVAERVRALTKGNTP